MDASALSRNARGVSFGRARAWGGVAPGRFRRAHALRRDPVDAVGSRRGASRGGLRDGSGNFLYPRSTARFARTAGAPVLDHGRRDRALGRTELAVRLGSWLRGGLAAARRGGAASARSRSRFWSAASSSRAVFLRGVRRHGRCDAPASLAVAMFASVRLVERGPRSRRGSLRGRCRGGRADEGPVGVLLPALGSRERSPPEDGRSPRAGGSRPRPRSPSSPGPSRSRVVRPPTPRRRAHSPKVRAPRDRTRAPSDGRTRRRLPRSFPTVGRPLRLRAGPALPSGAASAARKDGSAARRCAILVGWTVPAFFFSLAATKLPHYILPVLPPL
jgi:hypothetical protein